jgi:hypothetical protein
VISFVTVVAIVGTASAIGRLFYYRGGPAWVVVPGIALIGVALGFIWPFSNPSVTSSTTSLVALPGATGCAAPTPGGTGSIDVVLVSGNAAPIPDGGIVPETADITLDGWAVAKGQSVAASSICVLIDGYLDKAARIQYGVMRNDVAKALGNPALVRVGYHIVVPKFGISGKRQVTISAVSSDGSASVAGQRTIDFE